ncbi:MAG TPA: LLM class flavin-dependent oxidoreductase [Stellaceae bacterium]|jgi:natural product biosynthesis luciferase-like monooxygenase protein
MKFGHFCLPTFFPDVDGSAGLLMRRWLDLLAESEALGFDSLWANEHHFDAYGGIIPSPPTLLAALSQRTQRVRLGTSIVVLPLHSPIEIAEQLAMVDLMSSGRVEFGIGRGFVEFDYARLHVPREDSNERMREQLDVILKAWSGEPFNHNGRFYQYENLELWPKPEQRPHPPIWVSCTRTPSSFEWAGQKGFNVLTVVYHSVQNLVELNRIYREAWDKAGHPKGKWNLAAHYHCVLAESKQEARDIAGNAWRRYIEATTHTNERLGRTATGVIAENRRKAMEELLDTERMVAELRQIACTPDECVSLLERAQDAMGFTQCDCTFFFGGISFDQAQRSLRLFANEVMPKLRHREPRLGA